MLPTLLCALAGFFLAVHVATIAITWRRCRPGSYKAAPAPARPPVTVVRPLCGIETFSARTLESTFGIDYPELEVLFCVANPADPIIPLVEATMAAHPGTAARLLVGDDKISINPKLNNMVKGWRGAAHPFVAFIDSNVLVPADFVDRLVAAFTPGTGAVSAPPCGTLPDGFGAHLECAFLNTYEARWQYTVDTFGRGFAQGKTLFYRKADLDRSGMRDLAAEPAEDAATTKMVRRAGLRVRLAPPSPQPLGRRDFGEVWSRQLRWARLRRATFPLEFYPEILGGSVVPFAFAAGAAAVLGTSGAGVALGAYVVAWYAAELALAAACRWPLGLQTPAAIACRDMVMVALWIGAFTGSSFTWKGTAMRMEEHPRRDHSGEVGTAGLPTEQGF